MKTFMLRAFCFGFLSSAALSVSFARDTDTNPPPRLTVELRDGSRVVGTSLDKNFKFYSEMLGEIKLAVKDIRSIECVSSNSSKLTSVSGDSLTVSFVDSEFAVKTIFGKVNLQVNAVRTFKVSVVRPPASGRPIFNIDFGPGRGDSKQVGPAATGDAEDFWNSVSVGFNDDHTESNLKFANGQPSPIAVELVNLGGGWGSNGKMGVKAPMLDSFNYPANNQGGNSQVILSHVPPGTYALYLYGHGVYPSYYGDYTVSVAGRDYGNKKTSSKSDAVENTDWVEDSQYVRFPAVVVADGENLEILIRPGGSVVVGGGRVVADAIICGLQLVPVD